MVANNVLPGQGPRPTGARAAVQAAMSRLSRSAAQMRYRAVIFVAFEGRVASHSPGFLFAVGD